MGNNVMKASLWPIIGRPRRDAKPCQPAV